jgi:tetratricopeptide (TPR) repeat protein
MLLVAILISVLVPTGLARPKPPENRAEKKQTVATSTPGAIAKKLSAHPATQKAKPRPPATAKRPKPRAALPSDEQLKAELDAILKLPPVERAGQLEEFIKKYPGSNTVARALEFLISTRAALGDEKLRNGDRLAGAELFRAAVAAAPATMPDKLFFEVVSQLPANLYLLGEQEAGLELARQIEEKVRDNPQRLLALAGFYLSIERADDAARLAAAAVELKPDFAAAHQALGSAHRFALRLESAAVEFAKARELDPTSATARRSLADLLRATGKAEEALALYREQLNLDPKDQAARTGIVLSLFDAGKRQEAETELKAALEDQPNNLPLLVGASYWYAANNEGLLATELADRAVALEPRYRWVWARIALARAQLAQGRPLDAERALRPARDVGRFPTFDYELASILAAAGLYDEAAQELARSFTVKDGQIEAFLAGRFATKAASFVELLAPERRAGLFQFRGADSEQSASHLKALLAVHQATRPGDSANVEKEDEIVQAASDFIKGDDPMRLYRMLYIANRLTQRGVGLRFAVDTTEAAKRGVEPALDVPHASVALFADELFDVRARAIAEGMTTTAPDASRELLSKVMRGRIEDIAGWALFNQGDAAEAVVRLRRAVSVLPENTIWWKGAQWRLGAALDKSGNAKEALASYVKSFKLGAPDTVRYAVIEEVYRRINGSTKGLDQLLQSTSTVASNRLGAASPARQSNAMSTLTPPGPAPTPEAQPSPTAVESPTPLPIEASPTPSPTPVVAEPTPEVSTVPTPTPAPEPTATPTPTPEEAVAPTPSPTPEEAVAPTPTPTPEEAVAPTPTPTPEPTATPTPTPENLLAGAESATPLPAPASRQRRVTDGSTRGCTMRVSEQSLTIGTNGDSATLVVTFEKYTGTSPPRITAGTPNWSDITVFNEPRPAGDPTAQRFSVSSSSRKPGDYTLKLSSVCGKQDVAVVVR